MFHVVGCSGGPGRVAAADVDADDFADALFAKFDRDADGQLSDAELESAPYIKSCMTAYDADHNGQLALSEVKDNAHRVFDGKLGLMGASCRVTRNGKPLEGAIVYFVPLPGLEKELPVAGTVTASSGRGALTVRPEDLPNNSPKVQGLMRPGLYFVEVTHPTVKIPAEYNVKTSLGQEVTPQTAGGAYELALKF